MSNNTVELAGLALGRRVQERHADARREQGLHRRDVVGRLLRRQLHHRRQPALRRRPRRHPRGSTTDFTLSNHRNWGGTLAAWNATTGEGPLWTWQAPGGEINASPMTYQVNGKQYVAIYHRSPPIGTAAYNGYGDQLTVFSL